MTFSDEKILIDGVKSGNADAFEKLYRQYADPLYGFLWRKTRSEDTARDLLQDVFTRIWKGKEKLDPQQPVKAYLYRIANNLAIDHLRRKVIRQTEQLDDTTPAEMFYPEEWSGYEERLQNALKNLPPAQRNVFYLSRFEEFSYKEIAEILDISNKTVENQISAALKKLRTSLKDLLILILLFLLPG